MRVRSFMGLKIWRSWGADRPKPKIQFLHDFWNFALKVKSHTEDRHFVVKFSQTLHKNKSKRAGEPTQVEQAKQTEKTPSQVEFGLRAKRAPRTSKLIVVCASWASQTSEQILQGSRAQRSRVSVRAKRASNRPTELSKPSNARKSKLKQQVGKLVSNFLVKEVSPAKSSKPASEASEQSIERANRSQPKPSKLKKTKQTKECTQFKQSQANKAKQN